MNIQDTTHGEVGVKHNQEKTPYLVGGLEHDMWQEERPKEKTPYIRGVSEHDMWQGKRLKEVHPL